MSEAIRPLAIVEDYGGLVAALRQRLHDLGTTYDSLDHVSGMTKGWSSKTIGTSPIKRLGMASLGPMLGALGLKIALVVDEEAFAEIRPRLAQRKTARPCEQGPASASAPPA